MKHRGTIVLCMAAITGCAFTVAAVSVHTAAVLERTAGHAGRLTDQAQEGRLSAPRVATGLQGSTKPLMKPEELALLNEQIRASTSGNARPATPSTR